MTCHAFIEFYYFSLDTFVALVATKTKYLQPTTMRTITFENIIGTNSLMKSVLGPWYDGNAIEPHYGESQW